jgi:predicted nucleotidyltransferase
LLEGLGDEGERFVIIGAAALLHHVELPRITNDIDLAVVADNARIHALLAGYGWKPDQRHARRWTSGKEIVDVVPATPDTIAAGRIATEGGGELSMLGFDLALQHTESVPWLDRTLEVATLPVLIVLKMVAWLDRPYERTKDLGDLARVLERGLDDFAQVRWEPPLADIPVEEQCAFFMGQSVRAIAGPEHLAKVREFLARMEEGSWAATFAAQGQYLYGDPETAAKQRLDAFRRGLGGRRLRT